MYRDMKTVQINGKVKVQCSYTYREPIEEKFAPANSNREEALKATIAVIQSKFVISRPVRQALLDLVQQALLDLVQLALLDLKQY